MSKTGDGRRIEGDDEVSVDYVGFSTIASSFLHMMSPINFRRMQEHQERYGRKLAPARIKDKETRSNDSLDRMREGLSTGLRLNRGPDTAILVVDDSWAIASEPAHSAHASRVGVKISIQVALILGMWPLPTFRPRPPLVQGLFPIQTLRSNFVLGVSFDIARLSLQCDCY